MPSEGSGIVVMGYGIARRLACSWTPAASQEPTQIALGRRHPPQPFDARAAAAFALVPSPEAPPRPLRRGQGFLDPLAVRGAYPPLVDPAQTDLGAGAVVDELEQVRREPACLVEVREMHVDRVVLLGGAEDLDVEERGGVMP